MPIVCVYISKGVADYDAAAVLYPLVPLSLRTFFFLFSFFLVNILLFDKRSVAALSLLYSPSIGWTACTYCNSVSALLSSLFSFPASLFSIPCATSPALPLVFDLFAKSCVHGYFVRCVVDHAQLALSMK